VKHEHGLATTEATLALPVLALLLGGAWHLGRVLEARVGAQRDARAAAFWQRDRPDCGTEQADVRALARGASFPGEAAEKVPAAIDTVFDYGRVRADAARSVRVPPLWPGDAAERKLRGHVVVTCNEKKRDGLLDALFGILRRVSGL
jgi:TadE-like protein